MRARLALALLLAGAQAARAQSGSPASQYRGNYATPDAAAAKLLSVDPSKVLRPGNTQDASAAFGSFADASGGFQIPNLFGFQVGTTLFAPRLSVEGYRNHAAWYRTRFSVATSRTKADSGFARVALGISTTLIDDADLRTNGTVDSVQAALNERSRIRTDYRNRLRALALTAAESACLDTGSCAGVDFAALAGKLGLPAERLQCLSNGTCTDRERKALADEGPKHRATLETGRDSTLEVQRLRIDSILSAPQPWNARVFNLAVAAGVAALDSTGRGARNERFAGWATLGQPMGRLAQLLLSVQGSRQRQVSTWHNGITVSSRVYVGTNELKGFGEGQSAAVEGSAPTWLLNSGVEFQVASGVWLVMSVGWQSTGSLSRGRLVPGFSVLGGQGGKKKADAGTE